MRSQRILLLGLMGAGKTTVGRAVAATLGWSYVDNDDVLRARTGLDGAALLASRGDAALRAAEVACLRAALAGASPAVVGVAGGVVLDAAGRRLIGSGGFVVWLRAAPAVLAQRVAGDSSRARLGDDPAQALSALAAEREPHYARLADLIVEVARTSADEVAHAVVAAHRSDSEMVSGRPASPDRG
ncbi:MAG TPA: shikimate kinase [Mycobacteriales bacterium]|nr:shikimate kinase [Mycobacteriales bacterium]